MPSHSDKLKKAKMGAKMGGKKKSAQALFDKLKAMGYKQYGGSSEAVEKVLPGMTMGGPNNPDLVDMKMRMGKEIEYGYGGMVSKKKKKSKKKK